MMLRIGQGFDLHRLEPDRKLILGGVEIPFSKGLVGHSDADVLIHAVIDALIGALALGDIGKFYPNSDKRYLGVNSRELLKDTADRLKNEHGYIVSNLDSTIIIERPLMRPYIDDMRLNLAHDMGIDMTKVSIKAKTSEGVGVIGKEQAVAAQAVALLIKEN